MSEQVYYEDVDTGDAIPVLTVIVDETQMFFFSAATYNGHRIHYDKEWARDVEGYDDVLVQGPLQAALLSRALTDWIGGAGRLVALLGAEPRGRPPGPGTDLRRRGHRQAVDDEGLVDLDIFCRRGDDVLMPGTATVVSAAAGNAVTRPAWRSGHHRHRRVGRRTPPEPVRRRSRWTSTRCWRRW